MPPKRGAKAKAVAKSPPLTDCVVAVSGTFPGTSQASIGEIITELGGTYVKSVTSDCTHLISTATELQKATTKVKAAQSHPHIHIVEYDWLDECKANDTKAPESDHHIVTPGAPAAAPPVAAASKTKGSTKRSASPSSPPPAAVKKQKIRAVAKPQAAFATKTKTSSQGKAIYVPQDEGVNSPTHQVYIGPDGTIYDASLNQTNSSNNNNKFYRIQVGDNI